MMEVARVASACSTEEADWSDVGPSGGVLATTLTPNMTADTKRDKESLPNAMVLSPSYFIWMKIVKDM